MLLFKIVITIYFIIVQSHSISYLVVAQFVKRELMAESNTKTSDEDPEISPASANNELAPTLSPLEQKVLYSNARSPFHTPNDRNKSQPQSSAKPSTSSTFNSRRNAITHRPDQDPDKKSILTDEDRDDVMKAEYLATVKQVLLKNN
jgi:hypothetical protein